MTLAQPREGNRDHLLSVRDIGVRFGGIVALDGISFDVGCGQICGIIGPNGAGKTTLFNCLSRIYTPAYGTIVFEKRDILTVPRHRMAGIGIGRTFQNLALFDSMTVAENVLAGGHCQSNAGYLANILRLPRVAAEERAARQHGNELLDVLGLQSIATVQAGNLSFGSRKRVELARALASKPKLLLLDEPAGGLNHEEVDGLMATIRRIRDVLGVSVLLVEHHLGLVMRVSDKVVAMDFGRKIAEGTPAEIQADAEVISAYLGVDA